MKKITLLFAATWTIFSIHAQTTKVQIPIVKNKSAAIVENVQIAPVVYTDESSFLSAIGSDYYLEDFNDMSNASSVTRDSLLRTSNNYAYSIYPYSEVFVLYELDSAVSTINSEPMLVKNSGKNIRAFGGYFYSVDLNNVTTSSSIKIQVGAYSHTYTPTLNSETTFIGFVFPSDINDSIIVETGVDLFPVINRFYVSNCTLANIKEQKSSLIIYPNPFVEGIYAQVEGVLQLVDFKGQIVFNQHVQKGSYLNLAYLLNGFYIANIQTKSGSVQTKLIKKP